MRRVLYPGSFDPVHLGHVDVVEVAARLFDEVVVVAMFNPDKPDGFFTLDERQALLEATFAHLDNVRTDRHDGLVVQAASAFAADVIVKGLRSGADLDVEMQMAHTNKHVTGVQTIFVPTEADHGFLSSRYIREITAKGEDIGSLVPAPVAVALAERVRSVRDRSTPTIAEVSS